jgi:hypothetical protein
MEAIKADLEKNPEKFTAWFRLAFGRIRRMSGEEAKSNEQ